MYYQALFKNGKDIKKISCIYTDKKECEAYAEETYKHFGDNFTIIEQAIYED